jgi:acyl-CoA thioester hydrolase
MIPYAKSFSVGWGDCDVNGHMRNTAYSEYATNVRAAFLSEHGFPWERMRELGVGPVLTREEIDYLRELKMGDPFTVDFQQLGISPDGARFRLRQELRLASGKPAARLVLDGGWMDLRSRRIVPPPPALAQALASVPKAEGWCELPPRARR